MKQTSEEFAVSAKYDKGSIIYKQKEASISFSNLKVKI